MSGAENETSPAVGNFRVPGRGWVWAPRFDPDCGENGTFVTQNSFSLLSGDRTAAITGMRVILNNSFAPVPISGHTYASAQFIGRGSTEVTMRVAGISDAKISAISSMVEELEGNARSFRRIKGAGRVTFESNELLRLCGIEDGIVTSIDTETDSGGTNLYQCQVSFTSDGHHTEGFNQEAYIESQLPNEILDILLQKISVNIISPTLVAQTISANSSDIRTVSGLAEAAHGYINHATRLADDYLRGGSERVERETQRGAYINLSINTPVPRQSDDAASYSAEEDNDHPWLNLYLTELATKLTEWQRDLPGQTFFRGPMRGKYLNFRRAGRGTIPVEERDGDSPEIRRERQRVQAGFLFGSSGIGTPPPEIDSSASAGDLEAAGVRQEPDEGQITDFPNVMGETSRLSGMIHGRRRWWAQIRDPAGRDGIESNLWSCYQELSDIARRVYINCSGESDFDEVFGDLAQRHAGSRRDTVHPTYADLDLPPHPSTGRVVDTEPDFFWFNDGEEGLMNEVGPEIVREMDHRIQQMEGTYTRLMGGQTWRETYLGRNRIAPTDLSADGSLSDSERVPLSDGRPGLEVDHSTTADDANADEINAVPLLGGGDETTNRQSPGTAVSRVLSMSPVVQGNIRDSSLRNRREEMMRRTSTSLPRGGSREGRLGIGAIDTALSRADRQHSFGRNQMQRIAQQSVIQNPELTLTMRRAFPSFKVYFIEEDTGASNRHRLRTSSTGEVLPVMYFDDLYNYNSVKSIRIIRSRKSPADLLILELTNVAGLLERRRWLAPGEYPREIYNPGFEETELENPLKKIIMKEGLKVQARLGYTNDPNKMGIKFIGEVVEFSYNASCSDEVTIICQSYGSELTLEPKGVQSNQRNTFLDTPDLAHTIMCSPELVHFGRYNLNPQFNPAEARGAASSRDEAADQGATGLITSPEAAIQGLQEQVIRNRSKWLLANNPADDNIYAPGMRDHQSAWERTRDDIGRSMMYGAGWLHSLSDVMTSTAGTIFTLGLSRPYGTMLGWYASAQAWVGSALSSSDFQLMGQTIWEAFKELELRHPGWIAHPRPYGTRMTMFFGTPAQNYWADQISSDEMLVLSRLRNQLETEWENSPEGPNAREAAAMERINVERLRDQSGVGIGSASGMYSPSQGYLDHLYHRTRHEVASSQFMAGAGRFIGRTFGRYKPFRRHHLLTSDHHILANNIRASEKGTFNAVSLQYNGSNVYTLKADDSIPDEKTRVQSFSYPSCTDETVARRYCIGLLWRHLKDVYKGEIIVTGMDVDPYDQCYLHDERTGMYGGFEIEQVVDTFTPQTGWTTEITPDMIVGANEWSMMSTSAARSMVLSTLAHRYGVTRAEGVAAAGIAGGALATTAVFGGSGGVGIAATAAVGAGLAWLGGYYVVRWTQDRQPIWVQPLILGERPYFSGLDGFRQDGIFASIRGQLHAEVDALHEGWRQAHLSAFANDFLIETMQDLSGQTYGG